MKKLISAAAIFFFIIGSLNSQVLYDVRGLSMGNTSVANSYELDAFNQNPANIVFQRGNNNSKVYFNIFTTFQFLNNSDYLSLNFYNDYFGEDASGNAFVLTEADKQNIVNSASDQKTTFTASAKIFSVIYNHPYAGSFGISLDDRVIADFTPSKDFLDLGLYGNLPNRVYDLSQNKVNGYWTRQLNLSYAKILNIKNNNLIESISVGGSVKPQFGIYYFETTKNTLTIQTSAQNIFQSTGESEFQYSGIEEDFNIKFPSGNAGFGLGFDAGVNLVFKKFSGNGKLNIGLALADVGFLNWTKNNARYFNDGNFILTDITNKEQVDSLIDKIKLTKTPVPEFRTSLPTTVRFGATYRIYSPGNKKLTGLEIASVSFDYIQGITDKLGGTTKPRFGLGAEFNAGNVVSPRAGVSFGGDENTLVSLGLGIDTGPVIIDLGTNNITSIFNPKGTSNLSAGFNIKYKIN
ncbi:MAG: hypothetical protein IPM96_13330 [Ignavibacteria bacterium]|nr:hypothetical protein [Ignavibacteria bacterium]